MALTGLSGAEVNLVAQITLLFLMLFGTLLAQSKKFKTHGRIMAVAVLLQIGALIFWMVPSFIFGATAFSRLDFGSLITISHVVLGYCAIFLSISSALHKSLIGTGMKWTMRVTLLVWALTGILGFAFYVYYYVLR